MISNYEKVTGFDITLNRDTVFHLIDCHPNNPIYEEVLEEYHRIREDVLGTIKSAAFIKYSKAHAILAAHSEGMLEEGTLIAYVLLTIGEEIAVLANRYFTEGDYLLGMLVNAMADTYLFQMEELLKEKLKRDCKSRKKGITKKLEAPLNVPMMIQKDILDAIKKNENPVMDVTEGFMFTTVKTTGYILILQEEEAVEYSGHNCDICNSKDCKLRQKIN
jgi:hypothetical protein